MGLYFFVIDVVKYYALFRMCIKLGAVLLLKYIPIENYTVQFCSEFPKDSSQILALSLG